MNSKTLHYCFMGALVALGFGVLLSVYGANTVLERHSHTLVTLKAKKVSLAEQEKQLVKYKKDIATYQDLNTIAKTVVPQDKDQAEALRQIADLATQSGIPKLSSITFPPSTLGGAKLKTPAGLTQVTPVKGIAGVYNLQITVTQATTDPVPYSNFITFLAKLENNRRTAQVSSINVQPDTKNSNLISFTLVINEYIKPRK